MEFNDASNVEQVCYSIRLSDWPRAKNRVRIQNLFNGVQPFNEADAEQNGVKINVNPLTGTVLAHDARAQFYNAFLRPGRYFDMQTDWGPQHKVINWSNVVTQQINRKMKRSMLYFETFRSKFAMDVLHGIGPAAWRDADCWAPNAIGIEDVGIPSNTLLTMENLPFFYIYRSFTVPELCKLVNRKNVDRAWNLPLVKRLMKQVDKDSQALMNSNWPEVWSPEKTAERIKGDGGFYSSDQVQTINCFDFYFWNDKKGEEGWNRRMIMDPWSEPTLDGRMDYDKSKKDITRGAFLFNSGARKYADKLSQLMSFQFADLSAIAPFRYHSVRSLGFLVYGACHLQNRMYCRFNEAAFEASMNYLRINSPDDADRALKIDLINRGVIDKSVEFVKQQDRWQVNSGLLEMAMNENRRVIESNSNSWTQQGATQQGGDRQTKFEVMARIQQTTALVQSAFNQAYRYQEGEYTEIVRRFFKDDSKDIDVREFQAACLSAGVPKKLFNVDCWDIQPTQTMGDGNKTMEMAISEQLLSMRNLFDPEPQRDILRKVTFSLTGNAKEAEAWVPETPAPVSDSMHDAQLASAALMLGMPVTLKTGMDHKQYAITLIGNLMLEIGKAQGNGGMATKDQIAGYVAMAKAAGEHLQILSQDPSEKEFVNKANQQIGKLMNLVKAFQQRLQQQQQAAAKAQGGPSPETQAKIQATMMTTQAKLKGKQASDVQKQAHSQVKFEQQQQQERERFDMEQARENMKALHEVARGRMKSIDNE